jgi:uncharacterized damage-inducible protein DinB
MAEVASLELIHGLYDYHRWANRRLFDHVVTLGDEMAAREVGKQFSEPSVLRMFAHIYGADWLWLQRWNGTSPTQIPGKDVLNLAALRARWDDLEADQQRFLRALTPADLARVIDYKNTAGRPFRLPLWPLLQHVANHATHHRSEIATMVTMLAGSPPLTDLSLYHTTKTGQMT